MSSRREGARRQARFAPRPTAGPGRETDDGPGRVSDLPPGKAAYSCGHSAGCSPASPFAGGITPPDPGPEARTAPPAAALSSAALYARGAAHLSGWSEPANLQGIYH